MSSDRNCTQRSEAVKIKQDFVVRRQRSCDDWNLFTPLETKYAVYNM